MLPEGWEGPALVERGAEGRLSAPAELIVHEAAHILQYRSAGALAFLAYARGYLAACAGKAAGTRNRGWPPTRAIAAEHAARSAAARYLAWRAGEPEADSRLSVPFRG